MAAACAGAGAGAATGAAATAGKPCRIETLGGKSDAEANFAGLTDGTLRSSAGRTNVRANSAAGSVCVCDVELLETEAPRQRKVPKPTPIASAHSIAAKRMVIRLFDDEVRSLSATLHGRVKINLKIAPINHTWISGKWLKRLKQISPGMAKVVVFRQPSSPGAAGQLAAIQAMTPSFE
jgi:hypothetical protein